MWPPFTLSFRKESAFVFKGHRVEALWPVYLCSQKAFASASIHVILYVYSL